MSWFILFWFCLDLVFVWFSFGFRWFDRIGSIGCLIDQNDLQSIINNFQCCMFYVSSTLLTNGFDLLSRQKQAAMSDWSSVQLWQHIHLYTSQWCDIASESCPFSLSINVLSLHTHNMNCYRFSTKSNLVYWLTVNVTTI